VPPAPGIIASEVSGRPRTDALVAILISEQRDNSRPPPRAAPSMTEIVGQARFSNYRKVDFNLRRT